MAKASVRVQVEASRGDAPYELHVEPWGDTFDISEATPAVVVFFSAGSQVPQVGVLHGPDYVIVCANGGIDDYRVEDRDGHPLKGR